MYAGFQKMESLNDTTSVEIRSTEYALANYLISNRRANAI